MKQVLRRPLAGEPFLAGEPHSGALRQPRGSPGWRDSTPESPSRDSPVVLRDRREEWVQYIREKLSTDPLRRPGPAGRGDQTWDAYVFADFFLNDVDDLPGGAK